MRSSTGGKRRCPPPDDPYEAELSHHVSLRTDRLVAAGMAEEEAVEEALRAFGDQAAYQRELEAINRRKAMRPKNRIVLTFFKEFTWTLRRLRRTPQDAIGIVAVLCLGLTSTTIVYTIVDNVLVAPLPYMNAGSLVEIRSIDSLSTDGAPGRVSPPTFRLWSDRGGSSLAAISAVSPRRLEVGNESGPLTLDASAVGAGFFGMMGSPMLLGRGFTEADDIPGAAPTIVLTEAIWRSAFGADESLIGKTLTVAGAATTLVGVVRQGYEYPIGVEGWIPIGPNLPPNRPGLWGAKFLGVVGLLAPGVSPAAAADELRGTMPLDTEWSANIFPHIRSLKESVVRESRRPLAMLLGAVGLVLLVSCANVGSVLLARSFSRRREAAMRLALGGGRLGLVISALSEGIILALISAAFAILFATIALPAVIAWAPDAFPRSSSVAVDWRVGVLGISVALGAGVVAAVIPMLRTLNNGDLATVLREGGRSSTSNGSGTTALRILVVGELSLTLVLLTGAGLLTKSLYVAVTQDGGYEASGVVTFDLSLPSYRYASNARHNQFQAELLSELAALPGVLSAGAGTNNLPASGLNMRSPLATPSLPSGDPERRVHVVGITPGYLESLGIELERGRGFDHSDWNGATGVVLLNETAARTAFPGTEPLGQQAMSFFVRDFGEVIGIVRDVRIETLADAPPPTIYHLLSSVRSSSFSVVMKTSLPPAQVYPSIRRVVRELDPLIPIDGLREFDDVVSKSVGRPRFYMVLLGGFAAISVLVAIIGFYGVITLSVQRREQDIGIRRALGASASHIVGIVSLEVGAMALAGVALGVVLSLAGSRLLDSLLYGVEALDPSIFTGSGLAVLGVAVLAAIQPTRKALTVDPMRVIREE